MSENDNFQSVRLEYARQLDVVRGALHRQLGVMVSNNSVAHLVADLASKGLMLWSDAELEAANSEAIRQYNRENNDD